MNIIEDYVSFETAKLLKGKGYKGPFDGYYNDAGCVVDRLNVFLKEPKYQYYERASLYLAMKWLREEHKLNIVITPACADNDGDGGVLWGFYIYKQAQLVTCVNVIYESYSQCADEAIRYCLENLI